MFRLANPEWLLLLPLLAGAVWAWPRWLTGGRRWLRPALLFLLILALVRPELRLLKEGLDLWVIVDRSASADELMTRQLPEWEAILDRHRHSRDRLHFVDYASEVVVRDAAAGVTLPGRRDETRTAQAIRYAMAKAGGDRSMRLLLLSDGYSTEPLSDLTELLRRQQVALDYRITGVESGGDYQVESLRLPSKAAPGEPFLLELTVSGPGGKTVPFEVVRNGQPLMQGRLEIPPGQGRGVTRFADRVTAAGGYHYEVRILPENDPQPGNNRAEQWIGITGGPRVLLVTSYPGGSDPVAQALRLQQFEVEVVEDLAGLSAGRLHGVRTVILNNVPAYHLPGEFLGALDFFVREQGGGLLMAGGHQSFARGGYSGSPIDELLPVSMQLKRDHRKLSLAMAIALDRSGSMTAPAGSGTKMDMANAGTARSIELLNPNDRVAVLAVDTSPHVVVPLSLVAKDAARLADTVRGIRSAGGGIFIEEALKAAMAQLEQAQVETRHLVLFADASDSEQPGSYRDLLAKFTASGGTVSVIGLGRETDSDAPLLQEIAELGNGRVFFSQSGNDLPAIFEQETVAIARSAFIEEPTAVRGAATWVEIAARTIEWPEAVDGYNLSYLRPEAAAAALTATDEPAPLVAFWQRGSGRVAAVSFPLGGAFSERVRAWSGYGDFVQTLCRWLEGESMPKGLGLRTKLTGTELSAELFFDESWEAVFATKPPRLVIAGEEGEPPVALIWERMEPGLYRTTHRVPPGQLVRGALQVGGSVLPFGPLQAGRGAEWERRPERLVELAALARESGGEERVNLATVWDAPRRARFREVTAWLLGLIAVGFVAESLLSRLGAQRHISRRVPKGASPARKPQKPQRMKVQPVKPGADLPPSPPDEPPPAAPAPTAQSQRRERFARAKRKR